MQNTNNDKVMLRHESMQLTRLARLVDVVYAIIIWHIFTLLPRPTAEQLNWEHIGTFIDANIGNFAMVVIGIFVTIIYWLQNNKLLGNLHTTDSRHTILSILQLFFLMVFLLSLLLSIEIGASAATRIIESFTAVLVGISGGWGWAYAIKNQRLLLPEVTQEHANQLRDRSLAEPMTAVITIPFAFIGPHLWELAWLSYPLMVWLLRRRRGVVKEK